MKNKLKELDVDFIGGQNKPLTEEEELAISNFIKRSKKKRNNNSKTEKQLTNPKAKAVKRVLA